MDPGFAGNARWLIAETWAENYSSLREGNLRVNVLRSRAL
jgi:hypothetical protein